MMGTRPGYQKHYYALNRGRLRRQHDKNVALRREINAGRPKPEACEVCGEPGKVIFDHDHKRYSGGANSATRAFRGWICQRCNSILGLARDDPAVLRALIGYLEAANKPAALPLFRYGASASAPGAGCMS